MPNKRTAELSKSKVESGGGDKPPDPEKSTRRPRAHIIRGNVRLSLAGGPSKPPPPFLEPQHDLDAETEPYSREGGSREEEGAEERAGGVSLSLPVCLPLSSLPAFHLLLRAFNPRHPST